MSDSDHLTTFRRFFEEYVNTVDSNDPLPLRVASYSLREEELLGQIVDCCIQYLYLINCPASLLTYLSKLAIDEVRELYRANPLPCYEPLKIMQTATKTVAEICRRHLDNETLSKVPPPGDDPLVSALGIKHTRRKMEDRMVFIPKLHALYNVPAPHEAAYYAIFDGHGGPDAATYAVSHLHQFMVESSHYPQDVEKAMRESYAKTDNFFISKKNKGGSTGLVVLHEPALKKLTVSWLGDSQAMLIRAGKPIMLVNPHRPNRPDEVNRIHEAGGFVTEVDGISRVNGDLGVSRAFGDSQYKPLVSAEPDVITVPLDGTEEALILGCDGFWDVLDERKVCETFYFHVVNQADSVDLLSKRLVDLAKEFDSTDNISVIAVLLKSPSELTPPSFPATMETPELEPFRANGSLLTGSKHDDDDFGPETDVDAPDDGNPFGWTKPDPLQTYSDLAGLKTNPGVRFNNEYVGLDNPFSNNLHDIAEEKLTEDSKAEKEIFNNNEFAAKGFGNDLFGFGEFEQTNGHEKKLNDDAFILEKSDNTEVKLPDVVTVPDTTNSEIIPDEVAKLLDNKFERDVFEQEEKDKKEVGDDEVNPFDRGTPELSTTVVEANLELFDEGKKQVELETLKSMMLAESVNEDEPPAELEFPLNEPIDNISHENEFDGRFAAEDVVETGVDGDDSEEEWNYYQGDDKQPPSSELNNSDPDNMNSPLNPNAAEFVPVSPPCGLVENKTPLKAIPAGLLDDIASSPNWANMDAVVVPDVDTFLEGAKARPSNVMLDPSVEPFVMQLQTGPADSLVGEMDGVKPFDESIDSLVDTSQDIISAAVNDNLQKETDIISLREKDAPIEAPVIKEEPHMFDLDVQPREEPRGLDLATDMTSSFIDPSTMGPDSDEILQPEEPKVNGFGDAPSQVETNLIDHVETLTLSDNLQLVLDRETPVELQTTEEVPAKPEQLHSEQASILESEQPSEFHSEKPVAASAPIEEIIEAPKVVEDLTPSTVQEVPATVPVVDLTTEDVAEPSEPSNVSTEAPVAVAAAAAVAGVAAAAITSAAKKSPTKTPSSVKGTPRTPAAAKTPTVPKQAPARKTATPTAPRTTAAPKPAVPKATTATAKPALSKPKVPVTAAAATTAAKPRTTLTAKTETKAVATTTTTAAKLPAAAAKPAVKSTIPPRTATTTRPRVPSAPTNGIANGDLKTKKPAEIIAKKTAPVAARVPLTSRPATAPAATRTAAKPAPTSTTTKPLTSRPASAKPAAAPAARPAPKPATTVKKTTPAAKTNGVSKPAPIKRAVPAAKAETKTEAKTADEAPKVVSNGISATE